MSTSFLRDGHFIVPALMLATGFLCGCAGSHSRRMDQRKLPASEKIDRIVRKMSRRHGIPPALIHGMIAVESGYRPGAHSAAGARGLMQLMPRTAAGIARELGYRRYSRSDPAFSIEAGTYYMAKLLRRFKRNIALALAAYHTGPTRVSRWVARGKAMPGYSRRYVRAVLAARDRFLAPRMSARH